MSATSLKILPRLTAFYPASKDQDPEFPATKPATETGDDNPPQPESVTKDGITTEPVEVEPRFYRYVKGTATADDGETYDYTNRFISEPTSDDAAQQIESADCQALVQAELDRWLATKQADADQAVAVAEQSQRAATVEAQNADAQAAAAQSIQASVEEKAEP